MINLFRPASCIVVASMGRSGSTLCYTTLSRPSSRWRRKKGRGFYPSLGEAPLKPGTIIKTHDYPDSLSDKSGQAKVLFVFGSTYEASLSVYACREKYGDEWISSHFDHCKSIAQFDDIFDFDALGMSQQVRAWAVEDKVPVLCVRYDSLWQNASEISDFTGHRFNLPARTLREEKHIPAELKENAAKTYEKFDKVIAKLPDIFLAGPSMFDYVKQIDADSRFSKEARQRFR
ncbi:hypothetical protein [Yoonia sp.]|uniref:hypothetical protein n=1 Tax=Yoonia sp. TaxID=2212373 RepID=UPI001A02BCB6|nr:hypothetical protein [Yoonia sp.]MBE0413461.1 hypothetical protein [Yoonia sp.]